jgi:hypothetical protein
MPGQHQFHGLPTFDGCRTYYNYGATWGRQLIFVNGIDNKPKEHALSAQQIVNATGCTVLGIYNKTNKITSDLAQCVADLIELYGRGTGKPAGLMSINSATRSLVMLLLEHGYEWNTRPVPILAHSQGNLITSNALMIYSWLMDRKSSISSSNARLMELLSLGPVKIHVFAVASPAFSWPTNKYISVHNYAHLNDPVPGLSAGRSGPSGMHLVAGGIYGAVSTVRGMVQKNVTVTSNESGHSLSTYLNDKMLLVDLCRRLGTTARNYVFPKVYSERWRYDDVLAYEQANGTALKPAKTNLVITPKAYDNLRPVPILARRRF